MFQIESFINGKWTKLSNKRYSAERAANLIAYLIEEDGFDGAEDLYRYV